MKECSFILVIYNVKVSCLNLYLRLIRRVKPSTFSHARANPSPIDFIFGWLYLLIELQRIKISLHQALISQTNLSPLTGTNFLKDKPTMFSRFHEQT